MGLDSMQSLVIEGGTLEEVNFGHSHFSDIVLRRVKFGEGAVRFNKTIANTITVEHVDMNAVGFLGTKAKSLCVSDSRLRALGVKGGGIDKVYIRNSEVGFLNVSESTMPYISVSHSKLFEPHLYEGFIDQLSIVNSTIENAEAFDFKAGVMVWDNVTLDGEINLTNAQIKDFRSSRLKRGPNLNLITTGSNLRFEFGAE